MSEEQKASKPEYNLVKKQDDGKIALYQMEYGGVPFGCYVRRTKSSESGLGGAAKAAVGAFSSALGVQVKKENRNDYEWDKYITEPFASAHPEIKQETFRKELDQQVNVLSGSTVSGADYKEVSPHEAIVTPSGAFLSSPEGTMQIKSDVTIEKIKEQ